MNRIRKIQITEGITLNYKCTRNQNSQVTAAQAIVQGIAKDGGLFVPETLPQYTHKDFVGDAKRYLY